MKSVNLSEIEYLVFGIVFLRFFNDFYYYVFYLGLKSTLYVFRSLILNFVDGESDLRHVYGMVNSNKLNFQ